MNFNDLDLKTNIKTRIVKVKDAEIKVKQYLPIEDKLSLIQISLQQATQNGVVNEIALTAYFYSYIIMFYTDLEFTDEEKQDIFNLYDKLENNDLIAAIIEAIPSDEYSSLINFLKEEQNNIMTFRQSAAYLIGQFIDVLPSQMEQIGNIINNFDPNKYQAVIDFATAANGGRNIVTNQPVEKID